MNAMTIHLETTIEASPKQTYDFLTKPHLIPLVMPGLIENTNIPQLPLKQGDSFTYRYQLYGVMIEGTWTVTALEVDRRYDARTTGGIRSDWKYVLAQRGKGTHISLAVELEPPHTVLQKIQAGALQKILESLGHAYMRNLKTVLELQGQ